MRFSVPLLTFVIMQSLALTNEARAADKYVGGQILPKFGHVDAFIGARLAATEANFQWPATVVRVEGQWLWIVDDGRSNSDGRPREGWVAKDRVILLENDPIENRTAIDYFTARLASDHPVWAYLYRAAAWESKADYSVARHDYDEAVRADRAQGLDEAFAGRGRCSAQGAGDAVSAFADFREALRRNRRPRTLFDFASAWVTESEFVIPCDYVEDSTFEQLQRFLAMALELFRLRPPKGSMRPVPEARNTRDGVLPYLRNYTFLNLPRDPASANDLSAQIVAASRPEEQPDILYREAIHHLSTYSNAYVGLGMLYLLKSKYAQNRNENAQEAIGKIHALATSGVNIRSFNNEVAKLREVLRLDKSDVAFLHEQAMAYHVSSSPERVVDVESQLNKLRDIILAKGDTATALIEFKVAYARFISPIAKDLLDLATHQFEMAINSDANNPPAYVYRSIALLTQANLEAPNSSARSKFLQKALKSAQRAAELNEFQHSDSLAALAESLFSTGNHAEAFRRMAKAVELTPSGRKKTAMLCALGQYKSTLCMELDHAGLTVPPPSGCAGASGPHSTPEMLFPTLPVPVPTEAKPAPAPVPDPSTLMRPRASSRLVTGRSDADNSFKGFD